VLEADRSPVGRSVRLLHVGSPVNLRGRTPGGVQRTAAFGVRRTAAVRFLLYVHLFIG
jgi:hypothetical protein